MTPPPSLEELVATVRRDCSSDDPLALLSTAAGTAQQLTDSSDALLDHFVTQCREAGRSWSEISGALGVTKQAAHKRFAASGPTFGRFTPRARRVVEAAEAACRALGADEVRPEHFLLGLYEQPEGIAAKALVALGASQEAVVSRLGVEPVAFGQASRPATPTPFGQEARSVLRDAVDEALALGHNYIGTEHLLLALLRDPASPSRRALADLGVAAETVRGEIAELLRGFGGPTAATP